MIVALLVDPDDSPDFPGNSAEVLGRPLAAYPLLAAKGAKHVGRLYAQTSSPPVRRAAAQVGAVVLDPPRAAAGAAPPREEALVAHGWRHVAADLKAEHAAADLVVLLFANAGAVNSALIEQGVEALLEDAALDSAATVSCYERWTPRRAFRETPRGRLEPFATCIHEGGTPWFPDWGAVVARPRLLDALKPDSAPLAYLGRSILPLKQAGGGPVDRQWQVPKLEYWLRKQGVRDTPRLEPKLKPKPAARPHPQRGPA
ncbi:MAG: cytidylyltransferase [Elusimicrobia bacterium]|nr:cytidylyltransferase [Elusimicrobiota bacterium]